MNYAQMFAEKSTELLDKILRKFAPSRDRRAFKSAIDNLALEIEQIKQNCDLLYAQHIGKFGDPNVGLFNTLANETEKMRKKEFALNFFMSEYKRLFEKDYKPASDEDEVEETK